MKKHKLLIQITATALKIKSDKMIKVSLLLFFANLTLINSARILAVYPTPSISHQVIFRFLTNELVRQGHHITVITPYPEYSKGLAPANLTEIDLHDLSYPMWKNKFDAGAEKHYSDIIHQMTVALNMLSKVSEKQLLTKEVQDIIQKKKGDFDLLLLEACLKQLLGFSHIFKVPVIQISSFPGLTINYKSVGSTTHPFLYPSITQNKIFNLTTWDKLQQLYYNYMISEKLMNDIEEQDNVRLKKIFGPDVPSLDELANNIDLLFLNTHPMWIGNQPVPPNVVFIGGINKKPQREIPSELKSYLDSSTNGIIYVSFGTNIKTALLAPERIAVLVKVFSQLPYNILWKWDTDVLPGQTKNIKIMKWIPQPDVLKHRNIKLFITQCGLQSTEEAINAGVPLIGIPMFGDQWYNAENYVYYKIGVQLDMASLTEDIFMDTIKHVITSTSYRENILRMKNLMYDQPEPALQRAIWWIDYTLRHGGAKNLRARGANISWAQYLELEFVFTILSILLLTFVLFLFSIYNLWKCISCIFFSEKTKRE